MFTVIFRAEIANLDTDYLKTATRLRHLAINEFGCTEFVSLSEGNKEISISYWNTTDQIQAWRNHPEHIEAQRKGKELWYKSYKVQIAEISREYESQATCC